MRDAVDSEVDTFSIVYFYAMKQLSRVIFGEKDYGSFGMVLVGRNWSVGSEYRYGFNGKEQDSETYGEGNIYDYGFRIYNPRLGKFLSVDPLSKSYPWYTPYQFAGNSPILNIDVDGLEDAPSQPGTTPSDPNTVSEIDPLDFNDTERAIYAAAGGNENFESQPSVYTDGNNFSCAANAECLYDEVGGEAFKNEVNRDSYLAVAESTITPENFVILLLGNFMKGTGPENYVFPLNGTISNEMKNSQIVKDILTVWYKTNYEQIVEGNATSIPNKSGTETFGSGDFVLATINNKGLLNIEHFVGSARLSVEVVNDKEIKVTIFNLTSLTSGDISKGLPFNSTPTSSKRDTNLGAQPYTTISQTFSFTLPIDFPLAKYYKYLYSPTKPVYFHYIP